MVTNNVPRHQNANFVQTTKFILNWMCIRFFIKVSSYLQLTINLNKYNAEVNEKLSLEISNTDPGKLLLIGHERTSSRLESDGIISQINASINIFWKLYLLNNHGIAIWCTKKKWYHFQWIWLVSLCKTSALFLN